MVSALSLVVVEIVVNESRSLRGHGVGHASSHRHRVGESLLRKPFAGAVASLFHVESVVVVVAANAGHVVHGSGDGGFDAGVGRSRIEGDTSPAADADDAYAAGIDVLLLREEIDGCQEVLGIDVGRGRATWFAAAFACI